MLKDVQQNTKKLLRINGIKIATEIPLEERKKILFSVFDILLSQNQTSQTYETVLQKLPDDKKNKTKQSSDYLTDDLGLTLFVNEKVI